MKVGKSRITILKTLLLWTELQQLKIEFLDLVQKGRQGRDIYTAFSTKTLEKGTALIFSQHHALGYLPLKCEQTHSRLCHIFFIRKICFFFCVTEVSVPKSLTSNSKRISTNIKICYDRFSDNSRLCIPCERYVVVRDLTAK